MSNYIIDTEHIKVSKNEVTSTIELTYWMEKLWGISYEDIEFYEKGKYTKILVEAYAENFKDQF